MPSSALSLSGTLLTQSHCTLGRRPKQLSSRSSSFHANRSTWLPRQRHAGQPLSSKRLRHLQTTAISAPELGAAVSGAVIVCATINPVSLSVARLPRYHVLPSHTFRALQAAGDPGRFQNSDWASAFTSQLREYDYWVTKVEGTIPDTLRGTLFRNGPGRFASTIDCMHRVPACFTVAGTPCAKQQKLKVNTATSFVGDFLSDMPASSACVTNYHIQLMLITFVS